MGRNIVEFGVSIKLSEAEAATIASSVPGAESPAMKIGTVASGLMRDLAKGGTMLAPEWASRIETAIGTVEAVAIVESVEKSVGMLGESTRVEWIVDPTQINFYQEQADNNNITLRQQLKAHLDYAYAQGWLGSSAPDPFKILLSGDQYRQLQQIFARDVVTGEDVIEKLLTYIGSPAVAEEEDAVLESLGGR